MLSCVNVPLDCFFEWACGEGDEVMQTSVLILQLHTPNPFTGAVITAELKRLWKGEDKMSMASMT